MNLYTPTILLILSALISFSSPSFAQEPSQSETVEGQSETVEGQIIIQDPADDSRVMLGQMFFPNPMEMMGQGIEAMVGPMMDRMLEAMQKVLDTILRLSDDIGKMADRIGDFGDKILAMADRIGDMADRIVQTMEMMSNKLDRVANNSASCAVHTSTVLLLSPNNHAEISRDEFPEINISDEPSRYVIYASNYQTFSKGQTVMILINEENPLSDVWSQILDIAENDTIYIAVKSINDENQVSEISNSVKIDLI